MYAKILVPVDGSPTSTKGLDEAIRLAKLTGGRLRLLHVVDELSFANGFESYTAYTTDLIPLMREAGQAILDKAKARAQAQGVEAETTLKESLAQRLCDFVVQEVGTWGADLVVLGTHGRRGVRRFLLGSDAEQIVRAAPVPVLLVRADEADTVPAN